MIRQRVMVLGAVLLLGAPVAAKPPAAPSDDPDAGTELIGRPAPAWIFTRWVRGPERRLEDFLGKVVLVRWWTDGCHFCRTTLPALEAMQERHAKDSLVVLGVFHAKPEPREVSDRRILELAGRLGFSGPIAFDRDWRTLDRYWLGGNPERSWTSVSFLIDREGVIRWVHGGGEYHPTEDPRHHRCAVQYRELENVLAEVLAEP